MVADGMDMVVVVMQVVMLVSVVSLVMAQDTDIVATIETAEPMAWAI